MTNIILARPPSPAPPAPHTCPRGTRHSRHSRLSPHRRSRGGARSRRGNGSKDLDVLVSPHHHTLPTRTRGEEGNARVKRRSLTIRPPLRLHAGFTQLLHLAGREAVDERRVVALVSLGFGGGVGTGHRGEEKRGRGGEEKEEGEEVRCVLGGDTSEVRSGIYARSREEWSTYLYICLVLACWPG